MQARLAITTALLAVLVGTGLAARSRPSAPMAGVPQMQRAQTNWILKCQGCHRPDAGGTATTAPALAGAVSQFTTLPGGRAYLGRVPGVTDAALNDAELAELLNWTLQRFDPDNLPPDFRPYTAREIGELRRAPLRTDATATRRGILARKSGHN